MKNFSKLLFLITVLGVLLLTACDTRTSSNSDCVADDGTKVTSSSKAFTRLADDLQGECERMGGCTCYIDGIKTSCSIVFSCLEVGFCKQVSTL